MSGRKFLIDPSVHQASEKEKQISRSIKLIYQIYKTRYDIALGLFNTMIVEDDLLGKTMIRYCKRQKITENELKESPKLLIQFLFYYKHSFELGIIGG